ncbi:uncharacterized protein LOC135829216 [Sycon ciliatum]|uniref:uncharacterized protein LOC135829216 n=1 Tax=Sycon ciliatum TaxID=27933 RepID=UPI0020ACE40E|eukprot:scpid81647/ scgid7269/ Cyclin-dependent kinase 6; CR2 protein kinase; Cell division protein kinase 6; Serine/threonine-protein kinase PLSTIRE
MDNLCKLLNVPVPFTHQHARLPRVFHNSDASASYVTIENGRLGEGAFGTVFHAKCSRTSRAVAVKVSEYENAAGFDREIEFLRRIGQAGGHPNVIELVDVVVETHDFLADDLLLPVLNKCDKDLEEWMKSTSEPVPEFVRKEICNQLFAGLAFLHEHHIIHRDCSLRNILVYSYTGLLKIADFGMSAYESELGDESDHYIARRRDVRDMTMAVVIPLWLSRSYSTRKWPGKTVSVTFENENVATVSMMNPDLLAEAEYYTAFRYRSRVCNKMLGHAANSPGWWRQQMHLHPGLDAVISEVHSWALSQSDVGKRGMPVPKELHEALAYGCMLGPSHRITAEVIHSLIGDTLTDTVTHDARLFMRTETVLMNSTVV